MADKPETTPNILREQDSLQRRIDAAEDDADQISYRSLSVLNRVHSIASMACNELQGRIVDEGHRKAFMALTLIVREIQNG